MAVFLQLAKDKFNLDLALWLSGVGAGVFPSAP